MKGNCSEKNGGDSKKCVGVTGKMICVGCAISGIAKEKEHWVTV